MKRKIICLILVIVTTFSFSACGGNKKGEENNAGGNGDAVVRPENDDYYKMSEMTEIVTALSIADQSVMYPEPYTPSDNPVYDMHKDIMNISFENEFEVPWEAYVQQINLGIISGDLPEMFFADVNMLEELMKNDLIVDLTDYLEAYGTDELKEVLQYRDGVNLMPVEKEGRIYAIPACYTDTNRPLVWIRKDWMENLNKEVPTTMEELIDLAKAFTSEDPDKNSKDDTFGFVFNKDVRGYANNALTFMLSAYGGYPTVFNKQEDGEYKYLGVSEGMRDALETLTGLYKEGVLAQDFGVKDLENAYADVSAGKVGIVFGEFYTGLWPLNDVWAENGTEWECIPVPPLEGKTYDPYLQANHNGYYVVTKECKNPEALIKILNNTVTADLENEWKVAWEKLSDDPKNVQANNWLPACVVQPEEGGEFIARLLKTLETGDESHLIASDKSNYETIKRYLDVKDTLKTKEDREKYKNDWGIWSAYVQGTNVCFNGYDRAQGISTDWPYTQTKSQKKYSAVLSAKEEEMIIGVITGEKSLSDWDEYANSWWYKNGGSQILEEMKESVH